MIRWVRFRHNSSASLGTWEWREFHFPDDMKKMKLLDEYFKENYASDIIEEEYHTEHYRGIEWEIIDPPREVVEGKMKTIANKIVSLQDELDRLNDSVGNFTPREPDHISKKKCRSWPRCGCIKQFKHKDCREPYNWEK